MKRPAILIQRQDFDVAEQYALLRRQASGAGAIVTFAGLVREFQQSQTATGGDSQRRVQVMTLEHYPGMAENCLADIVARAADRWPLLAARLVHRVGALAPGEQIVFVGTASSHRQAAFDGARFIMDYLKSEAPLWKQHRYSDGTSHWVESRDSDLAVLRRWQQPAAVAEQHSRGSPEPVGQNGQGYATTEGQDGR